MELTLVSNYSNLKGVNCHEKRWMLSAECRSSANKKYADYYAYVYFELYCILFSTNFLNGGCVTF